MRNYQTWLTASVSPRVEAAVASADINTDLICPLRKPNFPPGTHEYLPTRHDLTEEVGKCMIARQEAQFNFKEYHDA